MGSRLVMHFGRSIRQFQPGLHTQEKPGEYWLSTACSCVVDSQVREARLKGAVGMEPRKVDMELSQVAAFAMGRLEALNITGSQENSLSSTTSVPTWHL